MKLQGVVNVINRGLLSTPGIASGIGKYLITLHVVGRESGRRYKIPVAYTPHEGGLLICTSFGWGRNLRTGEPLEVKYKGKRRTADVEVFTDESSVVTLYDVMCRDNHGFANFNKVRVEKDGTPNAEDLRASWRSGARAFKLTLR